MPANINRRETAHPETFFRTWGNPEQQYALTQASRAYRYRRLWDYYQGTAFDDLSAWSQYRRQFGLYRAIRQVWDHAFQLVEFYATHIWAGSLAADGLTLPRGVENAIPLAPDTRPELAAAIAQLWQWWNFQEQMTTTVRYTAALGECLVELVDVTESGRVLINLIWPSYVKDVVLDASGNVVEYTIEYRVRDDDANDEYTYKREVDKDFIRTYKDGELFDYDETPQPVIDEPYGEYVDTPDNLFGSAKITKDDGAEVENPYGFAPAVWFRHHRIKGVRGEPAIWSTQAQLDEANELFSHLLDKSHVSLEAPVIVSGAIAPNALQKALDKMVGQVKRNFTEAERDRPVRERETVNVLEGPQGTRVETIELKISEAMVALDRIISSIEKKCPEITFYQELRSMTQLTGPGAQKVLGDVERKVRSIAGSYDRNLIRLCQMGVTIAAMRYHEGEDGWADKSDAQEKFAPFNLDSFKNGDLDFDILPRSIVPISAKDILEEATLKKNILGDFIPVEVLAEELGYPPEKIEEWVKLREEREAEALKQQEDLAKQQAGNPPIPLKRPNGAPPGGPQRGAPAGQQRQRVADSAFQRSGV